MSKKSKKTKVVHNHQWFEQSIRNATFGDRWVGWFNYYGLHDMDGLNAAVTDWRLKMAGHFPPPHNVFVPWKHVTTLLTAVENCLTYHDIYFLRYWLDQVVRWEGDSYWNHVFEGEYRINQLSHRDAEKPANALVAEWQELFA